MHHGYMNDGWGGGWSWVAMAAMMVIFWGGLIWLAITVLRRTTHPTASGTPAPPTALPAPPARTPESILAERLARGDIDPEDYRQRLQALQDHPHDR